MNPENHPNPVGGARAPAQLFTVAFAEGFQGLGAAPVNNCGCPILIVSLEFRIMKTSQPAFFLLFFAGMVLMSFFGSEISRSIGRSDSWTSHLMLPGYSLGLIVISGSMFLRLTSKMRDLESKVQKLEKNVS